MSTYKELEKEFHRKVKKLQKICPHDDISDWMDEWWAVAHSTGYEVKVCNICNKIIGRRTRCIQCNSIVQEPNIIEGDGKATPVGISFCSKKCKAKYAKEFAKEYSALFKEASLRET